ncbi:MAG: hypothetical protein ACPGN3_16780 [Opitutales bacterium]
MHITRNEKNKAMVARIMRQGKMYQKSFSIGKYKTWKNAEKEAGIWLEELKKTLPPCIMNEKGRHTGRNSSGVVGVHLAYKSVTKKSGKEYGYWSWVARWPECVRKGGIAWHVSATLSDEDAFVLAVLTREMECEDKEKVLAKFRRIRNRKSYQTILERKMLMIDYG